MLNKEKLNNLAGELWKGAIKLCGKFKVYKYQAIYDTIKAFLSLPGNSFTIKGKYKPI